MWENKKPLFNRKAFSEVKREKLDKAKSFIQEEDPDTIASVDKDEYVDSVVSIFEIRDIEVATDKAQISAEEFTRDEDYELRIPIAGYNEILDYTPRTKTVGYSVRGQFSGDELRIELRNNGRKGWNQERLEKEIERACDYIDTYVSRLRSEISKYNDELERTAERVFESRREEIREQREMLGSLDVPLRQSDDTPDTFAIDAPERRDPITIEPPEPSNSAANDPAPTVSDETYQDVLGVINDVGIAFERSPHLFNDLEEEDLRDHILFILEQHFVSGSATGETFNKSGHSDILLRADDGTNVFVAECAIWNGKKYYTGKIDQLYRYLTWRDSKTAVILFVQNKKIEPVREQIETGAENHGLFVEQTGRPDESWGQYRFQFEDDPGREIDLAVLAFHIPPSN